MNERGKCAKPKFNAQHVTPVKANKSAQLPNIVNRPKTSKGPNPKMKPPKGPCPTGEPVCYCPPKLKP